MLRASTRRMAPVYALGALLLALTLALPTGAAAPAGSSVVTLTDDNFEARTSSGSWMIEFYAPWCGHCKTLAPLYEEAARQLRGTIHLAKIDGTTSKGLSEKYDVRGFPTLKFYREGEIRNYNGPRTVDGIVSFGKEMSQPAVSAITTPEQFKQLADKHPVSIVFVGGKGGVERRLFDSLAYRLQGMVRFFSVDKSSTAVLAAAGVSADETPLLLLVTAHADSTDAANRYAGPWVESEVRSFIVRHKLPLISELGQENFEDVTQSGKKVLYAVVNVRAPQESKAFIDSLYSVAKQPRFRDAFVFASLDGLKYNRYIGQFGVAVSDSVGSTPPDTRALPTVVVLDPELDYYYSPPARGDAADKEQQQRHPIGDVAAVERFLDDILAGRVPLTGTLPWYNPSRYIKLLEKHLSKLPVWQVVLLLGVPMLAITGALFWFCFAGLDSDEEERFQQEAIAMREAQRKKGKKQEGKAGDASASADKGAEGLRARGAKGDQ